MLRRLLGRLLCWREGRSGGGGTAGRRLWRQRSWVTGNLRRSRPAATRYRRPVGRTNIDRRDTGEGWLGQNTGYCHPLQVRVTSVAKVNLNPAVQNHGQPPGPHECGLCLLAQGRRRRRHQLDHRQRHGARNAPVEPRRLDDRDHRHLQASCRNAREQRAVCGHWNALAPIGNDRHGNVLDNRQLEAMKQKRMNLYLFDDWIAYGDLVERLLIDV